MERSPEAAARAGRGLPLLVCVSGGAALLCASLWLRSFGLVFGSTASASAVLLAVLMGGLALGSALAARRPSAAPLRAYARLELGVGVAALVSLPLLRALPWAYRLLVARAALAGSAEAVLLAALSALVLLPSSVLIGAKLPVALASLERGGADVRAGFGRLCALTTLGGASGLALGTYALLPALGVRLTLAAAAGASLVVGGAAFRLARQVEAGRAPAARAPESAAANPGERRPDGGASSLALVLAALSGAATFGLEALWTRSLALVIGSSIYASNVILVAALLGIAIGSSLYGRWRARITDPARLGCLLFAAAGLLVLAGEWAIGRLPSAWLVLIGGVPLTFTAHQLAGLGLCLLALLPVTAALGLACPLLLHFSARPGTAQRVGGRLCAWAAGGAGVAALVTRVVLVPRFGLQQSYLVCAALLLAGGVLVFLAASRPPLLSRIAMATASTAVVLAGVGWRPWDPYVMSGGVSLYGQQWADRLVCAARLGAWLRRERRLLFYREGKEAVVAVSEQEGRRFLAIDGRTVAGSGGEDVLTQKLIAHIPLLLHGAARRALVIGWGAGATSASAALHPLDSLECVEIEPATWESAPFFAGLNGRLADDPRVRIVIADGRSHLLRGRARYDVIVSDPSHPSISEASSLTREFHSAALEALAPRGVFGQRFHYHNLDPADVKVELATLLAVFPHASVWLMPKVELAAGSRRLGGDLLLVGSREPLVLDWPRLEQAFADERIGADLRSTRVLRDPAALVATWAMGQAEMSRWVQDRTAFPSAVPLNTDDYPYVELVAPRRNVTRAADAARSAAAQYATMSDSAGDVTRVLTGQPGLAAGGTLAAVFLDRLAERYAAAGQTARAVATFEAAAARDPADAVARSRAGELLLELERPAEAERQLAQAVRLDPTRARAWEALGMIALDRRDYARAEEAHRALLRLEPANVAAWLRLGAALARQGRWEGAQDALATALSIDPAAPVDPELAAYVKRQARGILLR